LERVGSRYVCEQYIRVLLDPSVVACDLTTFRATWPRVHASDPVTAPAEPHAGGGCGHPTRFVIRFLSVPPRRVPKTHSDINPANTTTTTNTTATTDAHLTSRA
jgi:hypothetical protein